MHAVDVETTGCYKRNFRKTGGETVGVVPGSVTDLECMELCR